MYDLQYQHIPGKYIFLFSYAFTIILFNCAGEFFEFEFLNASMLLFLLHLILYFMAHCLCSCAFLFIQTEEVKKGISVQVKTNEISKV